MVRGADEAAIRDLSPARRRQVVRIIRPGARQRRRRRRDERSREAARRPRAPRPRRRRSGAGAGAGAAAEPAPPAAPAAGVRRRGGREPCLHLGPGLAPPRRRSSRAARSRPAAATTRTRRSPRRPPPRCKRRRRGRPAPSRRHPKYAAQLAQLKEMGFTDERRHAVALDAAGGDVATAMGALVGYGSNSTSARSSTKSLRAFHHAGSDVHVSRSRPPFSLASANCESVNAALMKGVPTSKKARGTPSGTSRPPISPGWSPCTCSRRSRPTPI